MKISRNRIAINPLQWVASPDGWIDPSLAPSLDEQLTTIREAGLTAVHSSVPAGVTAEDYAKSLADHGLSAAPGYLPVRLSDDATEKGQLMDSAARLAEQHAVLGVPTMFLAMGMAKDAPRVARPAVGHLADQDRLERVRDLLAEVAGVIGAGGITPAFHPHVGTWAETEEETRFVLDTVDASLLAFGPDMGHLAWAGADAAQLVRDYADRVASVHIKDLRLTLAERAKNEGWDYRRTVLAGLWSEPGQGEADIDGFLRALPEDFDGWLIVEVDRGAQATPEDSVRMCGAWAAAQT
ncbi:sugar phosphate isomerase/epimerase [Nonomuraea sp. NEAU-A123]|uniref:sugar phosphate isomerase/epimerase family protein n=1 Tax=Nonomuraea sp. NEAU-A123 TaxID=2839649 RepID=UPI001BE4C1DF|nr:sugar phosphate isomerase/epimerase [Nonomuraea sp. NEAU-A123]MBT2233612.1 TIM barrel protein [Nonomuraea sp. NEAU-A123]